MKRASQTQPRRYLNAQDGCWHVQIVQGETHVTSDLRATIWCPALTHLATRLATKRMRSVEPMEVPPYL